MRRNQVETSTSELVKTAIVIRIRVNSEEDLEKNESNMQSN